MIAIEKHTIRASIISFVVYPMIGLMGIIMNLFKNQSIHFFGFNLILEEGSNFLRASLNFEWYFILTFLFVFIVAWSLDFIYSKLSINSHNKIEGE